MEQQNNCTKEPLLSVIVPCYKVEKYLEKCIESILAQSYADLELILIDDGSPDQCRAIIEKYNSIDRRIVPIFQKNQGVSVARNSGLRIARGKYVGFVDADDYIDKDMYNVLINNLERTDSDISCCNWNNVYGGGKIFENTMPEIEAFMSQEQFLNHIFDIPYSILGVVCNKVFKKELISAQFPEGIRIGEDTLFLVKYAMNIKSACYSDQRLYYIYDRNDSATRENPERMVEGLKMWRQIMDLVKNKSKKTQNMAERMYLDRCFLYLNNTINSEESVYLQNYFKKNIINVLVNKEIYWKTRLKYVLEVPFLCRNNNSKSGDS